MNFSEKNAAQNRLLNFAIIFLFTFIGFVIYWNALSGPFIFDDNNIIRENSAIKSLSNFAAIPWPRYLTYLTFALNYAAGGLTPFDYHLVNVIIHITNAILVYILARLLLRTPTLSTSVDSGKNLFIPFSAALIFLVHPVQTGAVSYITQRFAILAALFYLLTIILYIKARLAQSENAEQYNTRYYAASIIIMFLAQLTKENCFTIPLMLAAVEFFFFRGAVKTRALRLVPYFSLFIIIPAAFLVPVLRSGKDFFTAVSENPSLLQLTYVDPYTYLLTQFRVTITYLRLLFYPSELRILYDYPVFESFAAPQVYLSFIFLASVLTGSVYLLIRAKKTQNGLLTLFSFGITWFFIANIIEAVIPLRDIIFEHRIYLPGIGVIISFFSIIAYATELFGKKTDLTWRSNIAQWGISVGIAIIFSFSTHSRNDVWTNAMKFWQDAALKAPNSFTAVSNLGSEYIIQGKPDIAIALYRKTLPLAKSYDLPLAYSKLASALILTKKYDEAIELCYKALRLADDPSKAFLNLGFAFAAKKEYKNAEAAYAEAIKQDTTGNITSTAHNGLGNVYRDTNEYDKAIEEFGRAVALKPEVSIYHYNLAGAYLLKGDKTSALRHFKDALALDPNDPETNNAVNVLSADIKKK